MSDMNILRALCQRVHDDSVLQAHLFAMDDADEFVAAVRQLAESLGLELADRELQDAMNAGQRAWFGRKLP